jgi:hypothetical protein
MEEFLVSLSFHLVGDRFSSTEILYLPDLSGPMRFLTFLDGGLGDESWKETLAVATFAVTMSYVDK